MTKLFTNDCLQYRGTGPESMYDLHLCPFSLFVCFFIILFFICQDYTNTNGFPRNVDGGRPLDLNRLRYGSEDRDGSGNFVLTHKVSAYERELLGLSGYMHSS